MTFGWKVALCFGLVDVQEGFWTRNANKVMHSDLEPMWITRNKNSIP